MRAHPSYSSLTLFEQCPAAFAAAYHRGEPAVVPPNVAAGKHIHKACEVYALHCRDRKMATDFDYGRRLAAGLGGTVGDNFARWVENWVWEWSTVKAAPIEGSLAAMLPDGVTQFTGHPDLVQQVEGSASTFGEGDDLWVVTDFKSHWHGWPPDPPQQLVWYCWLVQQTWPAARDFLAVIAPLDGGPARKWTIGGGTVEAVGEELQGRVDLIAAETDFDATPGKPCLGCFYRLACPHRDSSTVGEQLQDPQALAQAGLWHAGQADVRRTVLKAHCEEHGPLTGLLEPTAKTKLVPRNSATIGTELQRFGLTETALRGGWDKAKIGRTAKALEKGGAGAAEFLGLFEERPAGTTWGWAKQSNHAGDKTPPLREDDDSNE